MNTFFFATSTRVRPLVYKKCRQNKPYWRYCYRALGVAEVELEFFFFDALELAGCVAGQFSWAVAPRVAVDLRKERGDAYKSSVWVLCRGCGWELRVLGFFFLIFTFIKTQE